MFATHLYNHCTYIYNRCMWIKPSINKYNIAHIIQDIAVHPYYISHISYSFDLISKIGHT